jgi:hypothetical protein
VTVLGEPHRTPPLVADLETPGHRPFDPRTRRGADSGRGTLPPAAPSPTPSAYPTAVVQQAVSACRAGRVCVWPSRATVRWSRAR